jgi:GTP-binding protein
MAFIDEIQFHARAGNGGDGVVRWRHEKNKEYSGAAGGNGGPGGDVYVRAVNDISILTKYKTTKSFEARNGFAGSNWSRQGRSGEDCYIDLPVGSVIKNTQTGFTVELMEAGQVEKILHGGRGGLGNEYFKASTNIRPEQSTDGREGESGDFVVELNLIADAGFIGLPNAGKSSLLNALTNSNAKVGSYAFTTLDPNLGVLHGYVLADIPGIIEGASEGKGLGFKFLKHVKRTSLLIHLVSVENDDIVETYNSIRAELEKYGEGLRDKPEIIVLTKIDLIDKKKQKELQSTMKKAGLKTLLVSVLDDESVKKLSTEIVKKIEKLRK